MSEPTGSDVTSEARGDRDSRASVTFDEAEAIRRRRAAGERGLDLAAEFGISPQVVCDIVHGRRRARPDREHLETEVERLEGDLDHEAREHQVTHERWVKAETEVKRLRGERDRFRAALGLLAELSPPHIMERYRRILREREGRSDIPALPSEAHGP